MSAFVEFSLAVVCLDCNAVSAAPQGKCVRCASTAVMTLADKLNGGRGKWTDQDLYDAYLRGCEDECIPEPLDKGTFLAAAEDVREVGNV